MKVAAEKNEKPCIDIDNKISWNKYEENEHLNLPVEEKHISYGLGATRSNPWSKKRLLK